MCVCACHCFVCLVAVLLDFQIDNMFHLLGIAFNGVLYIICISCRRPRFVFLCLFCGLSSVQMLMMWCRCVAHSQQTCYVQPHRIHTHPPPPPAGCSRSQRAPRFGSDSGQCCASAQHSGRIATAVRAVPDSSSRVQRVQIVWQF